MRVAFSADHGGAELKRELLGRLAYSGHELIDLGGDGSDPTDDYPDFARRIAYAVRDGAAEYLMGNGRDVALTQYEKAQ